MGRPTAVARYQSVVTRRKQPNKRIRKAAWREAQALIAEGLRRDAGAITQLRERVAAQQVVAADSLYGAQKYGRDVTQPLVIPLYNAPPPREPEHGFNLIRLDGRMCLWSEGAWVRLSGDLLRDVGSAGLRVDLAQACRFQEMRVWASDKHRLKFRDEIIDVVARYRMELARRPERR